MRFLEASYLILGIILGVVGIALVRWLLLRPTQRTLSVSLVEGLNRFNAQIRGLTDRMAALTRSLERPSRGPLSGHHLEIAETLSEMRRLLKEINEFFAREEPEEAGLHVSHFLSPDELEKFRKMERISDEEIARTDWEDLLDRLREEKE